MDNWRIELKNVGRGKATYHLLTSQNSLPDVEARALKECKNHLRSRDVEIEHQENMLYSVYAGFHKVGTVKLVSI